MSFPRSRSDTREGLPACAPARSLSAPPAGIGAAQASERATPATTLAVTTGSPSARCRKTLTIERSIIASGMGQRSEEGPRRAPPHERSSETAPRAPTHRLEHEAERELQVAHLVLG